MKNLWNFFKDTHKIILKLFFFPKHKYFYFHCIDFNSKMRWQNCLFLFRRRLGNFTCFQIWLQWRIVILSAIRSIYSLSLPSISIFTHYIWNTFYAPAPPPTPYTISHHHMKLFGKYHMLLFPHIACQFDTCFLIRCHNRP